MRTAVGVFSVVTAGMCWCVYGAYIGDMTVAQHPEVAYKVSKGFLTYFSDAEYQCDAWNGKALSSKEIFVAINGEVDKTEGTWNNYCDHCLAIRGKTSGKIVGPVKAIDICDPKNCDYHDPGHLDLLDNNGNAAYLALDEGIYELDGQPAIDWWWLPACDSPLNPPSGSSSPPPHSSSPPPQSSVDPPQSSSDPPQSSSKKPGKELVAEWKFNEGSGTKASDSTGHGLDGTLVSMTSRQWVTGVSGKALKFKSGAGVVTVEDAQRKLALAGGDASFSTWIKFSSMGSDEPIIKNGVFQLYHRTASSATLHWLVTITDKTVAPGDSSWNGVAGVRTNTNFRTSRWYHVVGVRSGGDLLVYVNGKLDKKVEGCLAGRSLDTAAATAMNFGKFTGTLDEISVYSGAMTQEEVTAEYKKYSGRTEQDEPDTESTAPAFSVGWATASLPLLAATAAAAY